MYGKSKKGCCLGAIMAVTLVFGAPAKAAIILLDFETLATGSGLGSTPLVTPSGTITVVDGSVESGTNATLKMSNNISTQLLFDFDVVSITFDYSGLGTGVFTGEVLDDGATVLDSFFDPSTGQSGINGLFDGTETLAGSGIRLFRFADNPGGGRFANVDNLVITTANAIPEPGTLALFGLGLLGLGIARRKRAA